jgi:hypothetical protein
MDVMLNHFNPKIEQRDLNTVIQRDLTGVYFLQGVQLGAYLDLLLGGGGDSNFFFNSGSKFTSQI